MTFSRLGFVPVCENTKQMCMSVYLCVQVGPSDCKFVKLAKSVQIETEIQGLLKAQFFMFVCPMGQKDLGGFGECV